MHVSGRSDMRSRQRRLPALISGALLALAASGVLTAQASAAAILVPEACVVNSGDRGSTMDVDGSGFTAGDSIDLTTNSGAGFGTATVGADGTFATTMTAPLLSKIGPAESAFVLTAQDETDDVTTATTTFAAANLAVSTKPAEAKPGKKVTYNFSGFTSGADIYAHYLHRRKVTATTKFGRAQGPCGTLKTRAKLYPGRERFETYKVQFDDSRHYSTKSRPRIPTTLSVFHF